MAPQPSENGYKVYRCVAVNCTHQFGRLGKVMEVPNGRTDQGASVHVSNCDVNPQEVNISGDKVYNCLSRKLMNCA